MWIHNWEHCNAGSPLIQLPSFCPTRQYQLALHRVLQNLGQQGNTTDWEVNRRLLSGVKLLCNPIDQEQNLSRVQVHQNCCKVKPARTKIAAKLSPRVPNVDRSLTICGPSVPHSSTTAAPPLFIRFTQNGFPLYTNGLVTTQNKLLLFHTNQEAIRQLTLDSCLKLFFQKWKVKKQKSKALLVSALVKQSDHCERPLNGFLLHLSAHCLQSALYFRTLLFLKYNYFCISSPPIDRALQTFTVL